MAHESPAVMTIPLIILALGAFFAGYVGVPELLHDLFMGLMQDNFIERFLEPVVGGMPHGAHVSHMVEWLFVGLSVLAGLGGFFLAYLLYIRFTSLPERAAKTFPRIYDIVYNKYYVDEIYDFLFVRPIYWLSDKFLWKVTDVTIVDNGMVNGTAGIIRGAARQLRRLQAGDVQSYAVGMVVGILAVIGFLLLK